MKKIFYILAILTFLTIPIMAVGDSTTNYSEKQVLNSVYDQVAEELKVNASVSVGSVEVTFPAVQTVDFSATQPVLLDDLIPVRTEITNTSLPVTGTFFQATQPVEFDTSNPLSVTFSGTSDVLIDDYVPVRTEITNTSMSVTGTFYPVTQPISGAVTVSGTVETKIDDYVPVRTEITNTVTTDLNSRTLELVRPATSTGATTVGLANIPKEWTFMNIHATASVYLSTTNPSSAIEFELKAGQSLSGKTATQLFYIFSTAPVTIQIMGEY